MVNLGGLVEGGKEFVDDTVEGTQETVDDTVQGGQEFVDDTVEGTQETADWALGSTDEAVGRTFDDQAGGGLFDTQTYASAAGDIDEGVRAGVDATVDNDAFSLQETVQSGMVEAYKLSSGDEDATDETVAKAFQRAAGDTQSAIGGALEGTPLDNPATDAAVWVGDAVVADPAKAVFRGLTGVGIDSGTTEGEVGAIDAFDIGITAATAGAGGVATSALRGASKSDEAGSLASRLLSSSDEAASGSDETGSFASRFLSSSDEAASTSDEGVTVVDDAASTSDDAGGASSSTEDLFNPSTVDEGASASDEGAEVVEEAGTYSGNEGSGTLRSLFDDGASTSDEAVSASDDAASASDDLDDVSNTNIFRPGDDAASTSDDAASVTDRATVVDEGDNLPGTLDESSGISRYFDDGASASDEAATVSDDAVAASDDAASVSDEVASTSDDSALLFDDATAVDDAVAASDEAASASDDGASLLDDALGTSDEAASGSDDALQAGEEATDAADDSGGLLSRFFGSRTGKATAGAGLFLGGGAVASSLSGDPRQAPETIRTASGYRLERAKDYQPTEQFPNGGRLYAVTEDFANIGYWLLLGQNGRNLVVLDSEGNTRQAKISAEQFGKMMGQQQSGNGGNG